MNEIEAQMMWNQFSIMSKIVSNDSVNPNDVRLRRNIFQTLELFNPRKQLTIAEKTEHIFGNDVGSTKGESQGGKN